MAGGLRLSLVAFGAVVVGAPAAAEPRAGFTVSLGVGLNVGTPFVEAQVGRRFERAKFFEAFADYSYAAAISTYPFHTLGVGARTYLVHFDRFELFHQAVAELALSSGGRDRTFGDRILGGLFAQGIGMQAAIGSSWSVAVVASTGYPVWLRSELVGRYTF
jgi:hypothetical protein